MSYERPTDEEARLRALISAGSENADRILAYIASLREEKDKAEAEARRLREAAKVVLDLLAFHEGSERYVAESTGEPFVAINARKGDGDLQTMLVELRAALAAGEGESDG